MRHAHGDRPPRGFNNVWLAMLPKGVEPNDTKQAATRCLRSLRPLASKNTDAVLFSCVHGGAPFSRVRKGPSIKEATVVLLRASRTVA